MKTIPLSPRMDGLPPSPASRMRRKVQELRSSGKDILDLSSGDLDFATPEHVIEAAHLAARNGQTRYTNVDGTRELKDKVRQKFEVRNGLAYESDEVIICNGSTQAIFEAFFATLAPGEEVLVPSPYWSQYLNQTRLAGGKPIPVPCPQNNGFKVRPDELRALLGSRARWFVLNNPTNPTGAVYSRTELAPIAEVMLDFPDVWILEDMLYEDIVFDDRRASSIVEVEPRLKSRTLVVSGVAKSYAMMGWRIGYAGGPSHLIRAMSAIQSQTTSCASSIGQAAAIAALSQSQDSVIERNLILAQNRTFMAARINGCAGLSCLLPEGAFYLLISCAGVLDKATPKGIRIETDRAFAEYLLEAAGVAVAAGEDFGLSPYVRASFGLPSATLEKAASRIERACSLLS
jgi:aspartate aminotransferase